MTAEGLLTPLEDDDVWENIIICSAGQPQGNAGVWHCFRCVQAIRMARLWHDPNRLQTLPRPLSLTKSTLSDTTAEFQAPTGRRSVMDRVDRSVRHFVDDL